MVPSRGLTGEALEVPMGGCLPLELRGGCWTLEEARTMSSLAF